MTVITAQRLNKIISEQGLTKTAFAKSIGVTRNYISILTSEIYSSVRGSKLSPSLAQLIGLKYPQKFRQKLNIKLLLNESGIKPGSFLLV